MTVTVLPSSTRGAEAAPLTAIVCAEGTGTVVALQGEADLFTRPILSDALSRVIAHDAGDVVIDLGELEFIDTAPSACWPRPGGC